MSVFIKYQNLQIMTQNWFVTEIAKETYLCTLEDHTIKVIAFLAVNVGNRNFVFAFIS
jgi:hypothetical protein